MGETAGAGGTGRAPSRSRQIALTCLVRVEKGDQANQALARQLGPGDLSAADRRLATELTYGTVRMQLELDYVLSRFLKGELRHLPAGVRAALRLGAYQLLHLTRVPRHAAVWESVELVRREGHAGLAGMANAVLRHVDPSALPAWPKDPREALSVRYSHPGWLVERWLSQYGTEKTEALLAYDNVAPPLTVRVSLTQDREWARTCLSSALAQDDRREERPEGHALVEPTPFALRGLRLRGAGEVTRLPLFQEGLLTVQDEASMLAVDLLGARPGELVVDACAGLGTKTWGLVESVAGRDGEAPGRVFAVEQNAAKVRELVREARRRHVPLADGAADGAAEVPEDIGARDASSGARDVVLECVGTVREKAKVLRLPALNALPGDARALPRLCRETDFVPDRVLLDAPCTGLGVLRRRPELRFRRTPQDAEKLHAVQVALLCAALEAVRPGGEVLYVTCSTERRENEDVVKDALSRCVPWAQAGDLTERVPEGLRTFLGEGGALRLFGPATGTDSFFFALLVRTE